MAKSFFPATNKVRKQLINYNFTEKLPINIIINDKYIYPGK